MSMHLRHPPTGGQRYQELYVGARGSANWNGDQWLASPLLAPREVLCKCPPTLLLVPEVDIYYAENIQMHQKLQEAGVEIAMHEYAEAVHPFMSMDADLPSGDRGMRDLVNFAR